MIGNQPGHSLAPLEWTAYRDGELFPDILITGLLDLVLVGNELTDYVDCLFESIDWVEPEVHIAFGFIQVCNRDRLVVYNIELVYPGSTGADWIAIVVE